MDTLGHSNGGTVGLFECHGSGGNQVSLTNKEALAVYMYYTVIKHDGQLRT